MRGVLLTTGTILALAVFRLSDPFNAELSEDTSPVPQMCISSVPDRTGYCATPFDGALLLQLRTANRQPIVNTDAFFFGLTDCYSWMDRNVVEKCSLLDSTFSKLLQLALFLFCCSALFVKWFFEVPSRQTGVFLQDLAKQVIGYTACHILNIAFALVTTTRASGDQCAAFWAIIVTDSSFGVIMNLAFLRFSEFVLGYKSGHYALQETQPRELVSNFKAWAWECTVFVGVVISSQLVMFGIMCMGPSVWIWVGRKCTKWIVDPHARLFYVMIVTPILANLIYILAMDDIIKMKSSTLDQTRSVEN
eukprot:TRINITY_DN77026_c0_g1_i1.p1 TRINITY_DN77026_c0_g1~~TRINITY_DN77026_c0_g1_i1.p1  ORF type:complete len:306 (+),score=27.44 TRINITY_DN77026_c0_g1_i1:101-1018(+)